LLFDALRQFGRAGCRIAELIKRFRKTTEVVDRFRLSSAANNRQARVPVRRDYQDRRRVQSSASRGRERESVAGLSW